MKLHNSVTNFFATKQQLQDRADKAQAEAAIEATAAEKAREAERIKTEKPTPTFRKARTVRASREGGESHRLPCVSKPS